MGTLVGKQLQERDDGRVPLPIGPPDAHVGPNGVDPQVLGLRPVLRRFQGRLRKIDGGHAMPVLPG